MATGLIATISGAATTTYTPQTNAKLLISLSVVAGTSFSVNGVTVLTSSAAQGNFNMVMYAAASVPITFTTTTAGTGLIVSAIEE